MNQQITTQDIQQALETLWIDMGALARNPLVEQLGLLEGWPEPDRRDVYKRASTLIDVLLSAAQRLKSNGEVEAFEMLDRAYGLTPELQGRHVVPDRESAGSGLTEDTYDQRLETALSALQSELEACSQLAPRMLTHDG